eukprot:NODE_2703_length_1360_cov_47.224737_g2568_i0.p1 GENE.NODE_2703_length_1360_cov_47.224737_g2568_i0~~NODE_2703_length_1360_cov_47.224737_g2568_i0.p1  ORF type:complete len:386 (-),score=25.44 NODE_2703_length_1360_cov_47.224737_g2568_i0:136-1293(-)
MSDRLFWQTDADDWWEQRPQMRGVNLGGWLLTERWMNRDLYALVEKEFDKHIPDEWTLCETLGAERAAGFMQRHRDSFITESDFAEIAALGLNAVRLPFHYTALEAHEGTPFVPALDGSGVPYLQRALEWAERHQLMVILDLHGLPGQQTKEHISGREREDWKWQDWDVVHSLDIISSIAKRFNGMSAVVGLSVVNEPSTDIPANVLLSFYERAYWRIRDNHMPHTKVSVIITAFPENRLPEFTGKLTSDRLFENVIIDLHYYQCFGDYWQGRSLSKHLEAPTKERERELTQIMDQGHWVIIGEWSLRLPWQGHEGNIQSTDEGAGPDDATEKFAREQLKAYNCCQGHFFWSWKIGNDTCSEPLQDGWEPWWSLQECHRRGWISW